MDVTDEMVRRCHAEVLKWNTQMPSRETVRVWLEAAVDPPEDSAMTNEMINAGIAAYGMDANPHGLTRAYRAMHAARPKDEPTNVANAHTHQRRDDYWNACGSHRRKDDK